MLMSAFKDAIEKLLDAECFLARKSKRMSRKPWTVASYDSSITSMAWGKSGQHGCTYCNPVAWFLPLRNPKKYLTGMDMLAWSQDSQVRQTLLIAKSVALKTVLQLINDATGLERHKNFKK